MELFSSKADTLKILQKNLSHSTIEKIFSFSVKEWNQNQTIILNQIASHFKTRIIIRSSAFGEDSFEKSEAGKYLSILNIFPNNYLNVKKSINSVIRSYHKDMNFNENNQILVQKQSTNVCTSGVVLTKTESTGLPYYVINYSNDSSTESVTHGRNTEKLLISRHISVKKIPTKWKNLIKAIKEIEKFTCNDALDIEFAINKNKITVFQVRPITTIQKSNNKKIDLLLENNIKTFKIFSQTKSDPIYSDMADWNPAEIIGHSPNLLDYSLYDFLIMNKSWYLGRTLIGYQKPIENNLMVKFGNKPYVDVISSFQSLIPNSLPTKIKKKLEKYYSEKLLLNLHLHDKIEFEIVFSCFDFTLDNRLKELKKYNFSKSEISILKSELEIFTIGIIEKYPNLKTKSLDDLKIMSENRRRIIKETKHDDVFSLLHSAKKLLSDCKKLGTTNFSMMARIAFISSILLKSLVNQGHITPKNYENFLKTIDTPLTKFKEDFIKYSEQKISKKEFFKKYGHLRPGTYDITAKRYDQSQSFSHEIIFQKTNKKTIKENTIILQKPTTSKINLSNEFFNNFIKDSIRLREEIKFEFTQNLSDALELIGMAAKLLNFSRDEISYLSYSIIFKNYNSIKSLKSIWSKKILLNKKIKSNNDYLILPPLIQSVNDFEVVKFSESQPNFITTKTISKEIISISNISYDEQLNNKIILIENADPGFDWIFTKNPSGLITKYGGVASHMAIRCAELNLPAAIGCGELIYEKLLQSSKILLDCKNQQILPLSSSNVDESIEAKKTLKSLGYIK
jgi:glutamine kinase